MINVIKFGSAYFQQVDGIFILGELLKLCLKVLLNRGTQKSIKKTHEESIASISNEGDQPYSKSNDFKPYLQNYLLNNNREYVMKNPLRNFYAHLKEIFDERLVKQGKSVESNIFLINDKPVYVGRVNVIWMQSLDEIYDLLTNQSLKLLFDNEIVDLILEKYHLNAMLRPTEEASERVSVDGTEGLLLNFDLLSMSYKIEDTLKVDNIVCPTVVSSSTEMLTSTSTLDHLCHECESIKHFKVDCRASGDIEKNILLNKSRANKKEYSQISRIIKAQKWLNIVKEHNIEDLKKGDHSDNEAPQKPAGSHSHTREYRNPEVCRRQRYIVKKSSENREELSAEIVTNTSNALEQNIRSMRRRFVVLKVEGELKAKKESQGTCKEKSLNPNKKYAQFKDSGAFSVIREDVINLANEINKHYENHSKNFVAAAADVGGKPSRRELNDRDQVLKEVRKRLQLDKVSNNDLTTVVVGERVVSVDEMATEADERILTSTELKEDQPNDSFMSISTCSHYQDPLGSTLKTSPNTTYKSIAHQSF